jgi:acetyltransferase EpsM
MIKVILIGDGGHSKVIREIISRNDTYSIMAILDDKYKCEERVLGIIRGPVSMLDLLVDEQTKVVVAIGNNSVRKKIVEELTLPQDSYLTIIDPSAVISATAVIGHGTVVMPNAVINADAVIGDHCIINTGAITEHENKVGNYVHLSPNATLTGNVSIEEGVHIGAAATIIPGKTVGEWSVIGAGSTVIKDIPPDSKAVGSPARIIKKVFEVVMKETM